MQSIIIIIIIIVFFVILLEYGSISKLYGQEELVIDEKVKITILKDNSSQILPAKIGIEPKLWKDKSLDNYSIDPTNISPLNTKRYDGIVYIQSIYDREFTLDDFLDIWGINKSKIIDVFIDIDGNNIKKDYDKLSLSIGQKLKVIIEKENTSFENFIKYNDSKILFEYPSKWNLTNKSEFSPKDNQYLVSSSSEKFSKLIEFFPSEYEYMTTPLFSIQITKLDSNKTIDEYYMDNIHRLLQANETNFPKLINKTDYNISGNPALKVNLNTTLIAEPGSKEIGNSINQRDLHIWTIKNDYFYDISFKVFESAFAEYYPIIQRIIKSIVIK
jgi:hypothetical protein